MIKKTLMISGVMVGVVLPVLTFAAMMNPSVSGQVNATGMMGGQTLTTSVSTSDSPSTATKIACVGAAVAAREAALGTAVKTHTEAVEAAYTTRAIELSGAYSNTTAKTVQAGVKVSWADFNKSVRTAAATWKESRNSAWSAFRTAVKACKAGGDVTDASNSGSEVSGS